MSLRPCHSQVVHNNTLVVDRELIIDLLIGRILKPDLSEQAVGDAMLAGVPDVGQILGSRFDEGAGLGHELSELLLENQDISIQASESQRDVVMCQHTVTCASVAPGLRTRVSKGQQTELKGMIFLGS